MSIIKLTRMIPEVYDAARCDGPTCTKDRELLSEAHSPSDWMFIPKAYSSDNFHFCSLRCLANWAAREADKAEGRRQDR